MKRKSLSTKAVTAVLAAAMLLTGLPGVTAGQTAFAAGNKNAGNALYVAADGNDAGGDGTIGKPYQTLAKAVAVSRTSSADKPTIYVRGGDYFLEDTLELDKQDSGLTIQNYENEQVTLSGAKPLTGLTWSDYEGNTKIKVAQTEKNLGIDQLFADKEEQVLCRYPNRRPGVLPLEGAATKAEIKNRSAGYMNPAGGYLRAIHSNGWGGNDYIITGKNSANALGLDYRWVGDNNRGNGMKDAVVVENVFEELDAPNEWFYDNAAGKLYFYPEEGMDLNQVKLEASVHTELVRITGENASAPVENITLSGFTYFGTKRSMFTVDEPAKEYIPLLRGDWCVVRAGAVYVENGKQIRVENSSFLDMGGNGIFFYGYNDSNVVNNNEFIDIGATAVQVVGDASSVYEPSFWQHALYPDLSVHKTTVDHPDQTGPAGEDYPRDIKITNNHMENMGIFEKQSCGVNLSVSSRIQIFHNTIHKSARSCINVNDGTFGGHDIAYNDIFNAQLETTDHGPFNSWGRDRFWSVPNYNAGGQSGELIRHYEKDGQSYDLALLDCYQTTKIHDNRFQHNADAAHTWGIDLDDGSSNYEIYNNLCLGLGVKLREGFNRKVYNNIILDGQFQIHVSYTEANDEIYGNIVANTTPFGFASVDESRFKKANYQVDKNWYFDFESKINLPNWFHANKAENNYDANALVGVNPQFYNPRGNDYTVTNQEGMEKIGFQNFPMDQFGKPGCACKAPIYAKTSSGSGSSDVLQREAWKGATVTGVDDNIISSTASDGYNGVYFEKVPADSEAYALGFRERDIVKAVNGVNLGEKPSFFVELNKIEDGSMVILDIHRTNRIRQMSYYKPLVESTVLDCDDSAVTYSTAVSTDLYTQNAWYFDNRKGNDQNNTICAFPDTQNANSAWFQVDFTGNQIEMISRKYTDQGDVKMTLINKDTGETVEEKTISCTAASRMYQQTVYTSPLLPDGNYTLKGQKVSGRYFIVDAFRVTEYKGSGLGVYASPAEITYGNGNEALNLQGGETVNIKVPLENKGGSKDLKAVYALYDISDGFQLIDRKEEAFTLSSGKLYFESREGYTLPEDITNKALQILFITDAQEAAMYDTWILAEGLSLPAVTANPAAQDQAFSVRYDKESGKIHATASGVAADGQTVLTAKAGEQFLMQMQVKAPGTKAACEFRLPATFTQEAEVEFTAAGEQNTRVTSTVQINPQNDIINKDLLTDAVTHAEAVEKKPYGKDNWYLFQKALAKAKEGLNSVTITQAEADQLAEDLNSAREALVVLEEVVIIKGNSDEITRTGEGWTVRSGSESCDTIRAGAQASHTFSKATAVEWYGVKAADHGIAAVVVSDEEGNPAEGSEQQVDCYDTQRMTDVPLYRFGGLDPSKTYTISVTQNGKNNGASSSYIEVYSFRLTKPIQEEPADTAALQELYDTLDDYVEEHYLSGWEEFAAAKENAFNALGKEGISNAEVQDVLQELQAAIDGLAEKEKGDKSELEQAIKEAEEALSLGGYVDTSVLEFTLKEANGMMKETYITQVKVDGMVRALRQAVKDLVKKVDKTALEAAVSEADSLDLSGYTSESVTALQNALEQARKILYRNVTQEEADQAEKALREAIAGLTKPADDEKPQPPADDEKPEDPADKNIEIKVEQTGNVPEIKAYFSQKLMDSLLTEEEMKLVASGKKATLTLRISPADSQSQAADISLLLNALNQKQLAGFMNIHLYKEIEGREPVEIRTLPEPIRLVLHVPDNWKPGSSVERTFTVLLLHDQQVIELRDLDFNPDMITVESDAYSLYAVTFTDIVDADNSSNQGNSSGSQDSGRDQQASGAKTGDESPVVPCAVILLAAATVIFKRKRWMMEMK